MRSITMYANANDACAPSSCYRCAMQACAKSYCDRFNACYSVVDAITLAVVWLSVPAWHVSIMIYPLHAVVMHAACYLSWRISAIHWCCILCMLSMMPGMPSLMHLHAIGRLSILMLMICDACLFYGLTMHTVHAIDRLCMLSICDTCSCLISLSPICLIFSVCLTTSSIWLTLSLTRWSVDFLCLLDSLAYVSHWSAWPSLSAIPLRLLDPLCLLDYNCLFYFSSIWLTLSAWFGGRLTSSIYLALYFHAIFLWCRLCMLSIMHAIYDA